MIATILARIRSLKPWIEKPGIVVWAAVLGAVLVSPSLFLGVQLDDNFLRMTAHGEPGIPDVGSSPWRAFSFADGVPAHNATRVDWGLLPWWSAPEVRMSFLRPLSSISHAIDFWYLEPNFWVMHLENIIWYAVLCALVAVLYRRSGMTLWVAGFAALLYAADDAHGQPAGWIAGRNAILTCLFGVVTMLCHDAWRRNRSLSAAAGAVIAFVLGLACGEAAIFVLGYLFAYALFIDQSRWMGRALSLVPCGLVFVCYMAYYASQHYGTKHSGLYADPFGNPLGFARDIALNLPALVQSLFTIFSANAYVVVPPQYHFLLHAIDFVMIALLIAAFLPLLRASKLARFWAVGMVLSLVPFCAAIPTDRLLCSAGIGGMALVGQFVGFSAARWKELAVSARRRLERAMAVFLVFTHAVAAPFSLPFQSTSVRTFGNLIESGRQLLPLDESIRNDSLVLVNPPVDVYTISMPTIQSSRNAPLPRHTWALNAGIDAMKLTRADDKTLIVRVEKGFFAMPFGITFRAHSDAWQVNDTVTVADFTATVLELTGDGRPRTIRFAFNRPLDDPSLRWFYFGEHNLEPFPLPGIGQTIETPGKSVWKGIWQMFKLAPSRIPASRD